MVWRGEGDLGAIGCVSIKTCHNSCRGIITECVEWGGGGGGGAGGAGFLHLGSLIS